MISYLLWRLRIRNRFALAWWAFCNPDNLTMLRHEMQWAADHAMDGHGAEPLSETAKQQYHGSRCQWLLERFLNLPVR
jgi:hypothetical protein